MIFELNARDDNNNIHQVEAEMPEIKQADRDAASNWRVKYAHVNSAIGAHEYVASLDGAFAAHREAAVDDVVAAIEARRVEWINELRNEGRSDGFIRIEPYLHGIVNALSIARRCTTTTPPEPLTGDYVKAYFTNHRTFQLDRDGSYQIQVTHGEIMFSFLVDRDGAVWYLPFKIGTRSAFAALVAAFGIEAGVKS